MAGFVRVKKYVGVLSVEFKSWPRKTLVEGADAVSSVLDTSTNFPEAASDVQIVEKEVVKDSTP